MLLDSAGIYEAESIRSNSRPFAVYIWRFLANGVGAGIRCNSHDHKTDGERTGECGLYVKTLLSA